MSSSSRHDSGEPASAAPPAGLVGVAALGGVALIVTDQRQRIALCSRGAEQLFGYRSAELLGAPIAQILPQLDALDPAAPPAREQRPLICTAKDGSTLVASAEIARVTEDNGSSLTILIQPTHPTAQTTADPEAQSALLHAVQDAVIVTDPAFRISGWNPAAEALYGWSAAEVLGRQAGTLLQTEYLDGGEEQALRRFREQGVWKGEVLQRHRDGRPLTILAAVALVRGRAGEPVGVITVNRDIGERKRAEAQLQAHAQRLEILTEASRAFAERSQDYTALLEQVASHVAATLGCSCSICLRSDNGRWLQPVAMQNTDPEVLAFTRATVETTPFPVDSPHPFAQVFRSGRPQLIPAITTEQRRAVSPPEYWPMIERFQIHSSAMAPLRVRGQVIGVLGLARHLNNPQRFGEEDLQLIQDLADRAALAIDNARLLDQAQRELAERQRAELALKAERELLARRVAERTADLSLANAELARAARLKDEFLASMSHELRTPLNSILGRAQALEEAIYGPVSPEQVRALQGIEESGQHLLALINDILDLSKIESGKLELERGTLDVDLLCAMCLRMVKEAAVSKQITITSRVDGRVELIQADERRLRQILVNLLANAVKFTPAGGEIGLEVRGDAEQGAVTFTVWDTGIGISPADLPKLFQPFVQIDSRLNRQYTGTGLGLALVLRLTKAHGGSVAVESTPGRGSRFSVTLPWQPEHLPAERPLARAAVDTALPAIGQALLVEDSAVAAAQITRYLHELGTRVETLTGGTDTVERAAALLPDLIILDILLPDDDGWDVLARLKAEPRTQAIPVLIVSVTDEPGRARALGAAALLVKPIDRATLLQTLRQLFTRAGEPPVQSALVVVPPQRRPRILLAEDNEANITAFSEYLQVKGYDLLVARNGGEALAHVQEERPDLILMDIQMPGLDGLEAIRRIRSELALREVPIIALTALTMPGDRERCLAAGADAYLAKPVNLRFLVATIEAQRQQR